MKQIIEREIEDPSILGGYRSISNKVKTTYNIIAPRCNVMKILREVPLHYYYHSDGPKETWHVDGYNKLKP